MDNDIAIPEHPATTMRRAAAMVRLSNADDYDGVSALLFEAARDPVLAGATLAALTKITIKLSRDAGVDLDRYLGDMIRFISASEPPHEPRNGWVSDGDG